MLKKLVTDTAIYGSGDFLFKIIGFIVFPIYAHLFTVEEFGIMSLVTVMAGLISLLLNMGMNNAVQRYYWDPNAKENKSPILVSTGLTILLLWSALMTLIALFILYLFSQQMEQRYGVLWIFIVLSLVTNIPAQILQYSQDVLRLHFYPWKFTLVSAWRNLFGVLLGLLLIIVFHQGLLGFFWGNFGALIISIPLGFWFIRQDLRFQFDITIAKKLILYGYPFIFTNLAYWIFGSLDRWMLSELSNNTEVGLYSIAFKFATIVIFVNTAFGQAWSPNAIKIYADRFDYPWVFSRVFSYMFFGLTVIGVVISLFGAEILRLTTPASYWPATTTLSVLVMSLVLSGTQQITALGISLERKTYLFSIGSWGTAMINVILNWLMIPKFGALGAAIATFFSYAVLSIFYLYWTQKFHPMPLEVKKLLMSCLIILFTLLLTFYLNKFKWNIEIFVSKMIFLCMVISSGLYVMRVSDFLSFIKLKGNNF